MIDWHDGEEKMHKLMNVPDYGNPTKPGLSAHAQRLLHLSSLLAIGTVDDDGLPWTTLVGGEPGFARSLGQSIVGVKALADRAHDPVLRILLEEHELDKANKNKQARDFSALGIHLASRDRVKLQGKMFVGGTSRDHSNVNDRPQDIAEVQMVFAIEGSLGALHPLNDDVSGYTG